MSVQMSVGLVEVCAALHWILLLPARGRAADARGLPLVIALSGL